MNTKPLKFDNMEVDTSLAEAWFKNHPELQNPAVTVYNDVRPFKIGETEDLSGKLQKLAFLVEENKDLFCQLEYKIRKIPVKTVEECDLKLLVNNLRYHAVCIKPTDKDESLENPIITISHFTPLVNLGFIADVLVAKFNEPIILSSKTTAAICTAFKELCQSAGLPVSLQITEIDPKDEVEGGCTGIITRRSDIESAIDTFLHAPETYLWSVKNIYVEESAIKRFKQAISWKANRDDSHNITPYCTEVFNYKGKLYLYEYAGTSDDKDKHVLIHSYRTVKDLLSIIKPSLSVSLWCSDVAESNEIANDLKSNIIWINDYINFNGSPRTAQSYFSLLRLKRGEMKINTTPEIEKLLKLQSKWTKIDIFHRRNLILDCLNLKKKNVNFELDDFVDVDKNFMCFGKTVQSDLILYDGRRSYIGAIIRGSGVISTTKYTSSTLDDFLKNVNAPIIYLDKTPSQSAGGELTVYNVTWGRTKVIWTSFGTIFAN